MQDRIVASNVKSSGSFSCQASILVVKRMTTFHWPATELFPIKVVGTRFYRSEISRIAQNESGRNALTFCLATLVPENNNPHDKNAVLVQIASEKIGHLSRECALTLRNLLVAQDLSNDPTTCDAVISAGMVTSDKVYDYIVELDLDFSKAPTQESPTYPIIDRRNPCHLKEIGNGNYQVDVWLESGVRENMHKSRTISSWTTDHWDTINYYAAHTKNCGLGHKLFSVPKAIHDQLFGTAVPTARFYSVEGRRAVIVLSNEFNDSFVPTLIG